MSLGETPFLKAIAAHSTWPAFEAYAFSKSRSCGAYMTGAKSSEEYFYNLVRLLGMAIVNVNS
jgi:hypothetical protein